MILKQVIKYDNAVAIEATWVEQEITPTVGNEGEEGYQPEQVKETVIKSTAYAGNQMDLFRADVAQYGGDISLYEDLIAQIEADFVPEPPPPETNEQIITRLEGAIDRYLDEQAQSFRYESIRTMVTYENDPNPKFNAEGVGAKAFRSAVYTLGVSLIDEVQSGLREVPTEEELLALMPKLEDFVTY